MSTNGDDIRLAVVIPVFNDWISCARLLTELDAELASLSADVRVYLVDDGSTVVEGRASLYDIAFQSITSLTILDLVCNLGNQRAIAVGLVEVAKLDDIDAVLVMDADGEDRPQDVPKLIEEFHRHRSSIIVAQRARRSEGLVFRVFYQFYKALFRGLTGKKIAFGNFSLIPSGYLRRLVYTPELWNNLAATLRRSRQDIVASQTNRGERYAGQPTSSLVGLIVHGLSALSVYSDVAFVRILLVSLSLSLLAAAGILGAVYIKVFTDWAIPNWTTMAVGTLSIMLLQALLISGGAVFLLLSNRSNAVVVPALVGDQYIRRQEKIFEAKRPPRLLQVQHT
ncbi:MAG: glycosyltransferase [Gammaproteobacteria bacterium]|nr:glycosyltransferase [Gammaproteobacteria bacterium]